MNKALTLLRPVWGLDTKDVAPLQTAVENGNLEAIQQCINNLENELISTEVGQFRGHDKYEGWRTEVEAKIAVLKAVLSNQDSDWQVASAAYDKVANALDDLARGCCGCEDIAQIQFECEAESARSLARLCLEPKRERILPELTESEIYAAFGYDPAKDFHGSNPRSLSAWELRAQQNFRISWCRGDFPLTRHDVTAVEKDECWRDGYHNEPRAGQIHLCWKVGNQVKTKLVDSCRGMDFVRVQSVYERDGEIFVVVKYEKVYGYWSSSTQTHGFRCAELGIPR